MDGNLSLFKISKINSISYFDLSSRGVDISFDNSWVMVFSEKGHIPFYADSIKCEVGKNNIYLFPPNDKLRILNANKSDEHKRLFIISMKISFFDKKLFFAPDITYARQYEYLLSLIAKEVKKAYNLTCGNTISDFKVKNNAFVGVNQVISLYIEQFLLSALEKSNYGKKSIPLSKKHTKLISGINDFLKQNIDKKFKNSEICENFNYSISSVNKLFKEYFDHTIHEHFLVLKVEEAKRLLREEKMSVSKISDKLGFNDPQNFSKVFKKYTGITPRDYINKIKVTSDRG